jgi:hypothetical protein
MNPEKSASVTPRARMVKELSRELHKVKTERGARW